MIKFIKKLILSIGLLFGMLPYAFAQQNPTLTVTLHSYTPPAQSIQAGATYFDVARITLTASSGDVYLNGIYLATDVVGGLSNFTNIYLYNVTSAIILLGAYPNQSQNPNLVQFSNITIGSGMSKTFLVRVSLAPSAAGNVRIGFSGFTFGTQATPSLSGVPIYSNIMTLPGAMPTPTPSPTPTITSTPTLSSTPSTGSGQATPTSLGFASLTALGLQEGETISAAGSYDPDIYIPNEYGYKRLFLNPIIFGFYGHLGGFANVKNVSSSMRDIMVTSGLFRNCEINDPKVYGVEITGEDVGTLHWVNTSGSQAVADDPEFFKKVFCINSNEFNWYPKGSDYASLNQVPLYSR